MYETNEKKVINFFFSPLNNFLIWSLSRHFLPFMSREYRAALQEFYSHIYGNVFA